MKLCKGKTLKDMCCNLHCNNCYSMTPQNNTSKEVLKSDGKGSIQWQEDWQIKFDEKFGYYDEELGASMGRQAGCDDCDRNIKERQEHKEFISQTIQSERKALIEKIEIMKKELGNKFDGDDWILGKHDAINEIITIIKELE